MASSATVSAPKKRKSFSEYFHSMRGQQLIVTLVFLFVPLVLLFMFTYLPFFKMVEFSFFKMKYIGRRTFVGLQNYISVFTRKDCFHALSLSLYYMVGSVVQMALALLFATILSFKCKGSKFFRGALYFPCLICGISVGFIFKFFFTHGFVLDTLLSWVGFNVDKLPFWLRMSPSTTSCWWPAPSGNTSVRTSSCSSVLSLLWTPFCTRLLRSTVPTHGTASRTSSCPPSAPSWC